MIFYIMFVVMFAENFIIWRKKYDIFNWFLHLSTLVKGPIYSVFLVHSVVRHVIQFEPRKNGRHMNPDIFNDNAFGFKFYYNGNEKIYRCSSFVSLISFEVATRFWIARDRLFRWVIRNL